MSHIMYDYILRGLSYLYDKLYTRAYGVGPIPVDIKKDFIRIQAEQYKQVHNSLEKMHAQVNTLASQIISIQGNLEQRIQTLEMKHLKLISEQKQADKSQLN